MGGSECSRSRRRRRSPRSFRVPYDGSAFGYRSGGWAGVIGRLDPDPANVAAMTERARTSRTALHPHSAGGSYINFTAG